MKYKGTGVAIVTPFVLNQVDYDSLAKIIEYQIQGGVDYIVSLGTTGETATLSLAEQKEIVQFTVKQVANRIPVVLGAGGNNTARVIEQMKDMQSWADFDAFLSVSPYYSKPSQEGIYQHYKAIAQSTTKQIILYNVPGRTSRNMSINTILRLANDFETIIGVKEAGANILQSQELAMHKPKNFTLISGDDDLLLGQLAAGFDGVISVVANAYPKEWSDMVSTIQLGNLSTARALFYSLYPFVQLIFTENNPAGIKCALHEMNLCYNEFRLPIVPVNESLDKEIRNFVRST